ncbi:MAG: cupin domain-containing protein [Sedimenticola sp.]|nr:cupin domain-containing protein [Sedimenticola sp.]MCW8881374.1 cupin domain-containing protein [Sedimenticola sp.]MCW8946890.1 cupin domain-containing protein [Sedimenticola sp.]MCW8949589.1 cupin domain-containing protein [Sedimenticola sp.]MCW8975313.1 cupin domain-containing protein [Sedimenticola sp.]
MHPVNLLKSADQPIRQEQLETLIETRHIRLQRILSPAAFRSELFQQAEDEWLVVLQGQGTLQMDERIVDLDTGDSLLIPAGTPHRVLSTSTDPLCIWLTLHLEAEEDNRANA